MFGFAMGVATPPFQLSPALQLTFAGATTLDSRIAFARADAVTCATYFDSTGRLATMGRNELLNSVLAGATSGIEGSTAVAPTNWIFAAGTGTVTFAGDTCRFVATAQRPFLQETLTLGTGTICMSATVVAIGAATTLNDIIAIAPGTATVGAVTFLRNGTSATSGTAPSVGDRVSAVATISVGGTVLARFGLGTAGAVTGDVTMAYPQLEFGSVPNTYSATTTAANSGPRFDYDPATPAGVTGGELRSGFVPQLVGSAVAATFDTSTGAGTASRVDVSNQSSLRLSWTTGKTYAVSVTNTGSAAISVRDFAGGTILLTINAGVSASTNINSESGIRIQANSNGTTATFTVNSVQELTFTPRGLLIEESRANLLLWSRDMTNAAWTKTDVTPTQNQVGIDGTANSATLMTEGSAGTASVIQVGAAVTAGSTVTSSVVLKRGNTDWVQVMTRETTSTDGARAWFNLNTGAKGSVGVLGAGSSATSAITSLGGGWYRCSVTCIPNGTYTLPQTTVASASADNSGTRVSGATYIVGHAQLEAGAFATSPILTTSASLVRSSESANMTGSNFSSWFNASAGTFVAEADQPYATPSGAYAIYGASDNTANNLVGHRFDTSGTADSATAISGGVNQTSLTGTGITVGAVIKVAHSYDSSGRSAVRNGGTVRTQAGYTVATLTQLGIGNYPSANALNGHIRRLTYYPTRLTNTQLQSLTS